MAKLRIYELAKELGLENKALLDLCIELGFEGKSSHSNTLSDDEADKLRRAVIRRAVTGKTSADREVEREGSTFTEKRLKGNVIRRRKKAGEEYTEEEEIRALKAQEDESIDLSAHIAEINFEKQTPDLKKERQARADAIRAADSLFEEETTQLPLPAEQEEALQKIAAEEKDLEETAEAFLEESEKEELVVLEQEIVVEVKSAEQEIAGVKEARRRAYEARLEEIRQRHDIRGPKVLGKIELPSSSLEKDRQEKKALEERTEAQKKGKKKEVIKGKKGKESVEEDDVPRAAKRKRRVILEKDELMNFEEEHESWRGHKPKKKKDKKDGELQGSKAQEIGETRAIKKIIKMQNEIVVGELAHQMSVKAGEVIKKLMSLGIMASINQLIDFDTATLIAAEFGYTTSKVGYDEEDTLAALKLTDTPEELMLRPPVVTVMGHVDHGKTSLLDAIRNTAVTDQEAGGITQHIGAYMVKTASGGTVTFIDTPGHAAFTEMRSRGAKVTDIVVLVVAADDGVMPQTIEAINHAKAAGVPIIVAINKIDKPGANIDRAKQQLAEYDLIPEEWGGQTIYCPVSAKTRQGIEELLENLAVQAEVLELKANPNRRALGAVIESRIDRGRGPVITVLVQNGTLKKGDVFVAGTVWGKVRAMTSFEGKQIEEAGPSVPVEVLGAGGAPSAGEDFIGCTTDVEARQIAEVREQRERLKTLSARTTVQGAALTLDTFAEMASSADKKELNLIVKADVQGSVEAVSAALEQLSNEEVTVRVIHKAVGAVNENDVQLAVASKAYLIAFNIRADQRANEMAEKEAIEIRYSRIIYELVETIQNAIKGLKEPVFKEKTLGRAEVRDTFKVPKAGVIAGSYVVDGTIQRGAQVRLLRDNRIVFEGKMGSLRRFKDDVREVQSGYECGISIDGYNDIKAGDIIEVFTVEQVQAL